MTSISRRHGLQALRRLHEGAHALVADWRLPWAVAMHRKGRLGAARAVYRRILLRAPRHFDVLQLMGLVALQRRRFREALAWFGQALALRPDDAMLHNHIGCAYRNAGLHEAAERHLLRARALAPHAFEPACNLGLLRASRHDIAGARAAYEEAARIDPSRPEPLHGLAHLLVDTHCLPAAIAAFDQLCARDPDDRAAWFGKTLAVSLAGDLAQANRLQQLGGDAARRGRRHLFSQRRPGGVPWGRHLACPEWQGDTPVAGRTVLVHAEAGYGDAIQYARFVPVLAGRGARVVLEVQPPLKGLLAALPGAAAVVARGDALPAHDLHIALEDLPIALDATQDNLPPPALALSQGRSQDLSRVLPAGLRADWAARLGPRLGALRVGLACSGNPLHERDRERSLPLALMLEALPEAVQPVCLQPALRPADRLALQARPGARGFIGELRDFTDTAALVLHMDLVLSVDTSIAHLSASLGKPTWILLPYTPDPRWMLDREDSPWYPAARLFRQDADWRWPPVLTRVRRALNQRLAQP